ncbi:MAG: hypothetical protein WDZ70_00855 [Candidatus Paceibacterota bacterium]
MNNKYIGIGVVGIAIIILLIILLSGGASDNTDTPPVSDDVEGFVPQEIQAIHTFSAGTHTLRGEIDLPTPCHTLTHDVMIAESFPEQVTINFQTEVNDQVVCAQVITPSAFEISFEASEDASIRTRFNDTNVPLQFLTPNPNTAE